MSEEFSWHELKSIGMDVSIGPRLIYAPTLSDSNSANHDLARIFLFAATYSPQVESVSVYEQRGAGLLVRKATWGLEDDYEASRNKTLQRLSIEVAYHQIDGKEATELTNMLMHFAKELLSWQLGTISGNATIRTGGGPLFRYLASFSQEMSTCELRWHQSALGEGDPNGFDVVNKFLANSPSKQIDLQSITERHRLTEPLFDFELAASNLCNLPDALP